MKKFSLIFLILFFGAPFIVRAEPVAELQAKIRELQTRVESLRSATGVTPVRIAPFPVRQTTVPTGNYRFTRTLSLGARGQDVTQLQLLLRAEGCFTGDTSEYFGPLTQAALTRCQLSKWNLIADPTSGGVLGPKTLAKLNSGITSAVKLEVIYPRGSVVRGRFWTASWKAFSLSGAGVEVSKLSEIPTVSLFLVSSVGVETPIVTNISNRGFHNVNLDQNTLPGTYRLKVVASNGLSAMSEPFALN